jgi:ABC-2 type transport system ATP-binding protein
LEWCQFDIKGFALDAIEVQDLKKSFGEINAVAGVSFNVEQGEIFSLLGPNGAGKTTTISMLSCLLRPDEGDALVMGHSIRKDQRGVKSVLGVVPQEIALYEDLTARENLVFWGKMYGLRGRALKERVDEVLEVIGLGDRAKDRVGKFSGGMKRRVNIAVALLHKPEVIYMDEPTVGIDPQSRRNILDNVVELKNQGMTVLYTTHYMEEAQELSDHIAIMDNGELIASGTHNELVRIVGEMDRIILTLDTLTPHEDVDRVLEAWRSVQGVQGVTAEDGEVTLIVDDSNQALPPLFEAASSAGSHIGQVDIQEPNLEAVFLHLTGRALRD